MSDNDNVVKPITPITMNPIRRAEPNGAEERYPDYRKSKKPAKKNSKKETKECIITPEKVDCRI